MQLTPRRLINKEIDDVVSTSDKQQFFHEKTLKKKCLISAFNLQFVTQVYPLLYSFRTVNM